MVATNVKVTKEQAARNREALVTAASKLFRERGIDGVGVADVSKAAGLTHGALYAQFSSKEELAAEALAHATEEVSAKRYSPLGEGVSLTDHVELYLSKRHRDNLGTGCPLAASGSEAARQHKALSRSFASAFEKMADRIEATLGPSVSNGRQRALAIAAAEIGALIVARGVAKADPGLSDELMAAARKTLPELGRREIRA